MKKAVISPSPLKGSIAVPPSKSAMHRALICAALSKSTIEIKPKWNSEDIKATVGALNSLGANITETDDGYIVEGIRNVIKNGIIDCRESGSTLRFLIPVAAALGADTEFFGHGRLPERSIGEYSKLFPQKGVNIMGEAMPYKLKGKLCGGEYKINSTLSSQYITGLLLALPLLDEDSIIIPEAELTSGGYIDMTLEIMKEFGVDVTENNNVFYIKGNQEYGCESIYTVEGDWSQAAFFLTAKTLGADIGIKGIDFFSKQGDKKIVEILNEMGQSGSLRCVNIDAKNIPDLVPILAVAASFAEGRTRIYNAARLRAKESNRLLAMCDGLTQMGVEISETEDGLIINGGIPLKGGICKGYNDHRIVMALSIAAAFAEGETVIDDAQSIEKSYPSFFEDYTRLGGKVNVIDVGE